MNKEEKLAPSEVTEHVRRAIKEKKERPSPCNFFWDCADDTVTLEFLTSLKFFDGREVSYASIRTLSAKDTKDLYEFLKMHLEKLKDETDN